MLEILNKNWKDFSGQSHQYLLLFNRIRKWLRSAKQSKAVFWVWYSIIKTLAISRNQVTLRRFKRWIPSSSEAKSSSMGSRWPKIPWNALSHPGRPALASNISCLEEYLKGTYRGEEQTIPHISRILSHPVTSWQQPKIPRVSWGSEKTATEVLVHSVGPDRRSNL